MSSMAFIVIAQLAIIPSARLLNYRTMSRWKNLIAPQQSMVRSAQAKSARGILQNSMSKI